MRGRLVLLGVLVLGAVVATVALALADQGSRAPHRDIARAAPAPRTPPSARAPVTRRAPTEAHRASYWRTHVNVMSTLPAGESRCQKAPRAVAEHPITHRRWLTGVTITEYYPAPERWFIGRRARAPGLRGAYAVDWLYSARGLAMEGDGVDSRGRQVHIAQLGATGWVDAAGRPTVPVCLGKWSHGFPVWLIGGWRNTRGQVTFPLASGGWSNGRAVRTLPYGGVAFAAGPSLPLRYYHSIAVDPHLIPLGSRVFVPAYRHIAGGWFIAQDTGGAIVGRHIDVYRPAPASPENEGRYMTGRRILVIPPA
jgi:3D (Asp-Asp-Asp) domain-containing protein